MTSSHWKNASTLLLAAGNVSKTKQQQMRAFDYKVLMVKRSQKSKFMGSAHVFPGGILDDADCDDQWLTLIRDEIAKVHTPANGSHPPLYSSVKNSYISLRICALRELFEETGILLAHNSSRLTSEELSVWRHKVAGDASQFYEMCRSCAIVPQLSSLYEWSNWLTPVSQLPVSKRSRRYDTMFYIASQHEETHGISDNVETTAVEWASPDEVLCRNRKEELWIAPPQVYELLRLSRLSDLASLEKFFISRSVHGCERWLPVRVTCKDGFIAVLPGDHLYPDDPDLMGDRPPLILDRTLAECRQGPLNRNVFAGMFDINVECDMAPRCGHVNPIKYKAQL